MSGQNTGSCEVRSVGWWPNAKQNSRGDMSGHLTRMRGVVTACPAGIWVACGVGSREEWEKAERGGSVPTQLHKNLLSSTLDLASWGLALLPHSSTRQVPRSGRCPNLVCPDIMMNRADRRQRQLHSLHFASSVIGLCLSKNRQDLAPITLVPISSCFKLLQAFSRPVGHTGLTLTISSYLWQLI